MRVTIPMVVAVCTLCWCLNTLLPSLRPGSQPTVMQPAVTQAEMDTARAAREQRLRDEPLPADALAAMCD